MVTRGGEAIAYFQRALVNPASPNQEPEIAAPGPEEACSLELGSSSEVLQCSV